MGKDGFLKALAEIEADEKKASMHDPQFGPGGEEEEITPKMVEVVKLLQKNLLLVQPTLQWLRMKEAEMAQAQLSVLYSLDELEEMKRGLEE